MATIQTGSIVNDIRGRVGDVEYCRNASGPFIRGSVTPIQPNTSFQLAARADMATTIAAWQAMTDEERMLWIVLANQLKSTNRLGVYRKISGSLLFRARKLLALSDGVSSNPVPRNDTFNINYAFSVNTFSTSSIVMASSPAPTSADHKVQWFLSPPVSTGHMSPNSQRYTFINSSSLNSVGLRGVSLAIYESIFGSLAAHVGEKVFIKAVIIQTKFVKLPLHNGPVAYIRTGSPVFRSAIITA